MFSSFVLSRSRSRGRRVVVVVVHSLERALSTDVGNVDVLRRRSRRRARRGDIVPATRAPRGGSLVVSPRVRARRRIRDVVVVVRRGGHHVRPRRHALADDAGRRAREPSVRGLLLGEDTRVPGHRRRERVHEGTSPSARNAARRGPAIRRSSVRPRISAPPHPLTPRSRVLPPLAPRPPPAQRVRAEREALARRDNDRHFPLSFASLRIAAANVAAVELGVPVHDAVSIVRCAFFTHRSGSTLDRVPFQLTDISHALAPSSSVSRGYHLAWIPARGEKAAELLFDGAREMLRELRANHPNAAIGSITNGLGSAASAGLGEFFDFEISADELMDSEGVVRSSRSFVFIHASIAHWLVYSLL